MTTTKSPSSRPVADRPVRPSPGGDDKPITRTETPIGGVAYVMVYDRDKTLIAHTFVPLVPPGIVEKNLVPGESAKPQVRDIQYPDPVTGITRDIIDIGVPMLGGQVGTVRVGMDRRIVLDAARQAGLDLLKWFAVVAGAAVALGALFAWRITKRVGRLVTTV